MAMQKPSCKNTPQYLTSCCSPIGQNNTKDFSAQSGGSIGRAVWKWSGKSRFPGAFFALLVNIRRFISHSRPQMPRSFWSAPRIATSGQVQRHSGFEWICKHNRLKPEPIRVVRLDSDHAQSNGKSVNRGLPLLELARGRDSWC